MTALKNIGYKIPESNFHSVSYGMARAMQVSIQEGRMAVEGRCRVVKLVAKKCWMALKVSVFAVAYFICRAGEFLCSPLIKLGLEAKIKRQCKRDISTLPSSVAQEIRGQIYQMIEEKGLRIPEKEREFAVDLALASYANSRKNYGPVVYGWTRSVLDTALKEGRKVFFMARDGGVVYRLAKKLKNTVPEYKDISLSYVYLSRKVVKSSKENGGDPDILKDYLKRKGLEDSDRCLFVDIGFSGSMIGPIREMIDSMEVDSTFLYLISRTKNAEGYLSNAKADLNSVRDPGNSPSVFWAEDCHSGVIASPQTLVRDENGKVYPEVKLPNKEPKTCAESFPHDYLMKSFAIQGVLEYGTEEDEKSLKDEMDQLPVEEGFKMAPEKIRDVFDAFLEEYCSGKRCIYSNSL